MSDAKPNDGSALNKMLKRALTIVIGAPTVFFLISLSKFCAMAVVYVTVGISSMEWSGLKRHLKVAILHKKSDKGRHRSCSPTPLRLQNLEGGEEEEDSEDDVFDSPLLNRDVKEFDLPVPTLTGYNILKHIGWSFLCVAGACGELPLLVLFISYFLIFVGVTIMAHNHLEMKVEEAIENLRLLTFTSKPTTPLSASPTKGPRSSTASAPEAAGTLRRRRSSTLASQDPGTTAGAGEAQQISITETERHARLEKERFRRLELSVIVDNQPAEQFVDFCLDIFGILWISGMTAPLLVYSVRPLGFAWIVATMMGNFMNDIMALVTGRTVKAIVSKYFSGGSLRKGHTRTKSKTNSDGSGSAVSDHIHGNPTPPSRSLKGKLVHFMETAPHPLYEAISPNKSVEGAVAGVLTNAITFANTLSLLFWLQQQQSEGSKHGLLAAARSVFDFLPDYWPPQPTVPPHLLDPFAYRFNCYPVWLLVGLLMGIAGVIGDLLQSLLKRVSRVKDAGDILPGHGGMLDRIDGMLITFPLMYIALQIILAAQ